MTMQKIVPHLWFDKEAEDAAKFYMSVFKNSRIINTSHYGEAGQEITGMKPGMVMTVEFEIEGQRFLALNGGPIFKFSEAISFVVNCESQGEIDDLWEKLSADPKSEQCGWLKDKYGLSWQVIPKNMVELIKSPSAMEAMLKMKKIDIATLKKAA